MEEWADVSWMDQIRSRHRSRDRNFGAERRRRTGIIRVGAPLPLTGPFSPEGIKQKQGYDLWAETANAKGGIKAAGKAYKVEIVYVDYASNTPRAVQTAERLITEDKVNFLFSPFGSGATKAASGVSEKYGIPTIAATASSEQVYDQGYKYLFGTFTPNDTLTEPLTNIVTKRDPNVKRVAILARNDLFPLAIGDEMEKSAKKRNLDVVMFEKYAIGTMDHASAITQMRAAKPDWIFATGYINDLILIRKQMKDLGVSAPVVTMIAGPAYKEFIDATGPLAENMSSAAWWHPAVRYDGKGVFGSTENFNKLWSRNTRTCRTMHRPPRRRPAKSCSSRSRRRTASIPRRCATRLLLWTPRHSMVASNSARPGRSPRSIRQCFRSRAGSRS